MLNILFQAACQFIKYFSFWIFEKFHRKQDFSSITVISTELLAESTSRGSNDSSTWQVFNQVLIYIFFLLLKNMAVRLKSGNLFGVKYLRKNIHSFIKQFY